MWLGEVSVCLSLTGDGFYWFTEFWHLIRCPQCMDNTIDKLHILNRQIPKALKPESHCAFLLFFIQMHSNEFYFSESNELNFRACLEEGLGT